MCTGFVVLEALWFHHLSLHSPTIRLQSYQKAIQIMLAKDLQLQPFDVGVQDFNNLITGVARFAMLMYCIWNCLFDFSSAQDLPLDEDDIA